MNMKEHVHHLCLLQHKRKAGCDGRLLGLGDRGCRAHFTRLQQPFCTSSTFSLLYVWSRGLPAVTGGPPPCIFSARTAAERNSGFTARHHNVCRASGGVSMSKQTPQPKVAHPTHQVVTVTVSKHATLGRGPGYKQPQTGRLHEL